MQTQQFRLHAQLELDHWWFVARRRVIRRVLHRLVPPNPQTLLVDVGCGTGGNLADLRGDYRCVGVDTSGEAIRFARERFPGLDFRCGAAPDDIAPLMARAQVITLLDVMEHVPDDFWLLSRLWAAAAPGTLFLLTVPAGPELWSPHDEAFGHWRRYTRARFQQVWQHLPGRVRLVSGFNSRLQPVVRAVRWWNRLRGETRGGAGTDFTLPPRWLNRALEETLAGESRRLLAAIDRQGPAYEQGVSWIAAIERTDGPVRELRRPDSVEADRHQPVASVTA